MADPVELYFKGLSERHRSGALVDETTYYPLIEALFTAAGSELSPAVKCFSGLKNLGAGMPDLGLFTPDQYRPGAGSPRSKQAPSRGVIEAKPPSEDVRTVSTSKQVRDYLDEYGLVLVTTCREFLLLARPEPGRTVELESLTLAPNEAAFWEMVDAPRKAAASTGSRLSEYLKRVMIHQAPISNPEQLAWLLASYAQEAKVRVAAADPSTLDLVKSELSESLGVKFNGPEGDEFFRSSFVQALFYGLFSSWVLWAKKSVERTDGDAFDWRTAAWSLEIPVIGPLFSGLTAPHRLGPLGIAETLDWSTSAINRVDKRRFFEKFEERHAIQFFYEPFLEQFDPSLRKSLGVWYTPTEVVQYMVERVDRVLRDDLGLPDGLADKSVYVLDPCCGTGSYLVEVLRRIARTLESKHGPALVAAEVKTAAVGRIFGFEILPAPFVVAHLQLGLLLQEIGAPLNSSKGERAAVYLTNSLTGWEPPAGPQKRLSGFFDLEQEREAAGHVKQKTPILVVIGNPPYNAFAGVSPEEEMGLVEPFKEGLAGEWGIRKYNLDDLYIRFLRLAERRIAEQTGRGVVCFVTNFSYLGHPSFVVMRQRFLQEFDRLWFDCLNGDSRETGKRTPAGEPDPSIFSTLSNPEGIRVGTAIGILLRTGKGTTGPVVRFRNLWGGTKREQLLADLTSGNVDQLYVETHPRKEDRFSFRPGMGSPQYDSWPSIDEICAVPPYSGAQEGRDKVFIVPFEDRNSLEVFERYLDPAVKNDQIRATEPRLMKSFSHFNAEKCRTDLLKRGIVYRSDRVVPYLWRSFDVQFAYLDPKMQPAFNRPRPELLETEGIPNIGYVLSRDTSHRSPEGPPFYFSTVIPDYHSFSQVTKAIPTRVPSRRVTRESTGTIKNASSNASVQSDPTSANLSSAVRSYLAKLGLPNPDEDASVGEEVWYHVLAIGFSPMYVSQNASGLAHGWPRVPVPSDPEVLKKSASLGRKLSKLLDPTSQVSGVSSGDLLPGLNSIAEIRKVGGGSLNPDVGDLDVTAGWGHGTPVVMPGAGRIVQRPYTESEHKQISLLRTSIDLTPSKSQGTLGGETVDVYLNEMAFWSNIPIGVWSFVLGGTQVLKKWLSYREHEVLGRSIVSAEAREFSEIARRVANVILLETDLDSNYVRSTREAFDWPALRSEPISEAITTSKKSGFGGQVSFGKSGRMKGTASLKKWGQE